MLVSAETLKDVEITADGQKYSIQVDAAADSYTFGKKKVEKEEFAALYQTISGIGLVSEINGKSSTGKEEPRLTVSLHRNIEGAPDVEVSYYPYDDKSDSVAVDGEERFLVKKEEVEVNGTKGLIDIMRDGRQVDLYLKEKKSDADGYMSWDVEHWSSIDVKRFIRCYSLEGRVLGESTGHNIYDLENEFKPEEAAKIELS